MACYVVCVCRSVFVFVCLFCVCSWCVFVVLYVSVWLYVLFVRI